MSLKNNQVCFELQLSYVGDFYINTRYQCETKPLTLDSLVREVESELTLNPGYICRDHTSSPYFLFFERYISGPIATTPPLHSHKPERPQSKYFQKINSFRFICSQFCIQSNAQCALPFAIVRVRSLKRTTSPAVISQSFSPFAALLTLEFNGLQNMGALRFEIF